MAAANKLIKISGSHRYTLTDDLLTPSWQIIYQGKSTRDQYDHEKKCIVKVEFGNELTLMGKINEDQAQRILIIAATILKIDLSTNSRAKEAFLASLSFKRTSSTSTTINLNPQNLRNLSELYGLKDDISARAITDILAEILITPELQSIFGNEADKTKLPHPAYMELHTDIMKNEFPKAPVALAGTAVTPAATALTAVTSFFSGLGIFFETTSGAGAEATAGAGARGK